MHQFGDVPGAPGAPMQHVQFHESEPLPHRLTVTIVDNRPLLADCLAEALRRTAPDFAVRSVPAVEAVDPKDRSVVLYSFVGRADDTAAQDLVLGRLRAALPRLPVVIIADEAAEPRSGHLALHGLSAWLTSEEDLNTLASAIRAAALADPGSSPPGPERTRHTLQTMDLHPSISAREGTILGLVHRGRPNKLIAHELGISESTVKVHLRNLMAKLRVHNRTQLALMWHHYERRPLAPRAAD